MRNGRVTPWWFHALAALFIGAFFLQALLSSLIKSPTSDEPPHIAAGLSYVQLRNFIPNPQHPPLLKEMAAASLLLAGVRLPQTEATTDMLHEAKGVQLEWGVGNDVIARGDPARVLFWARLPLIVLSTLLGVVIWLWGRMILGDLAALAAVFLFAADPNMIAHSQFVTTDMGMTVFSALFFFLLCRYVRNATPLRLVWCGIAMGLLLCSKFSSVFMLPVALVLMLAPSLPGPGADSSLLRRQLLGACGRFALMILVAALVIMAIYASPAGLAGYWRGFQSVYADANPNYKAYMAGQLQRRFYSYFAVAWLLKEPLAVVAAVIFGTVTLLRRKTITRLDKLFLFLPPLVMFLACTFFASNIGIRYFMPAFPFFCLAGGAGLATLFQSPSGWQKGLAALLCVWPVAAAAGIYPDHLSYFNEAACLLHEPSKVGFDGGTRCGPWWLDDSNTDWGQGLEQLRRWRNSHPDSRGVRLAYFGNFPPELYGIVPQYGQFPDGDVPDPGLYVVSVKYIYRVPLRWFRTLQPSDIIGHALYVFDVRPGR